MNTFSKANGKRLVKSGFLAFGYPFEVSFVRISERISVRS